MKIVYLHDENGFYTGESIAQESPREPGVFIVPVLSTDIKPVISANFWPKFVDGAWTNVADWRGTVFNTETGLPVIHDELGSLPSTVTTVPKPEGFWYWTGNEWMEDIAAAKDAQIKIIESAYSSAISANIDYMSATFDAGDATQLLLVKVLSSGSVPSGFFWQDINNNQVAMTFTQLKGFSSAMVVRGQIAFIKLQDLKNQIRAITSNVAEVGAVIW